MKKALNVQAAALTVGGLWALALFVLTFVAMETGYAAHLLELLVGVYPGYELSTQGAFLGLLWGFLDGFIGMYVLVYVYRWVDKMLTK